MLREAARVFGSLPLAARVARVRAILLSLTHIRPVCAVQPRLCGDAGAPPGGGGGGERESWSERRGENKRNVRHERARTCVERACTRERAHIRRGGSAMPDTWWIERVERRAVGTCTFVGSHEPHERSHRRD